MYLLVTSPIFVACAGCIPLMGNDRVVIRGKAVLHHLSRLSGTTWRSLMFVRCLLVELQGNIEVREHVRFVCTVEVDQSNQHGLVYPYSVSTPGTGTAVAVDTRTTGRSEAGSLRQFQGVVKIGVASGFALGWWERPSSSLLPLALALAFRVYSWLLLFAIYCCCYG